MLHPKGTRRIFDKEKSNIFSNDFANGKIDTIMGLATLSLHLRKSGFSTKKEQCEPPINADVDLVITASHSELDK